MAAFAPRTLCRKIWDAHTVVPLGGNEWLLYIDRHLVYEVASPQAFDGLRAADRSGMRCGSSTMPGSMLAMFQTAD